MPVGRKVFSFPELPERSFHGLPGLLSDSVPDKFGNAVIDVWLRGQRREPGSLSPIERLCYTGARGMGALEYRPSLLEGGDADEKIRVERRWSGWRMMFSGRGERRVRSLSLT